MGQYFNIISQQNALLAVIIVTNNFISDVSRGLKYVFHYFKQINPITSNQIKTYQNKT